MNDFISRTAALDALMMSKNYLDAYDTLEQLPSVDAVPVKHGRWRAYSMPHWTKRYDANGDPEYKYHDEYVCSICRRRTIIKENYCPTCGAKNVEE